MTKRCKVCESRFFAKHRRVEICPICKAKIASKPMVKSKPALFVPELEVAELSEIAVLSTGNPFVHDP